VARSSDRATGAPAGMCQITRRRSAPASSAVALLVVVDGSRGRRSDYVSWPGNVPPAVDDCDGSCSHRFSFEFVRSSVGASGLTLTIVRGPVKSTVRSASEGIYRPIRPPRRIRWCLKCASWSSRTSGHRRASSSRACLRAEGHAVTVYHDGESGEAAALTGDYALVLLDLLCPARPASTCLERAARMPEPASDRADRARSRRAQRGSRPRRERLGDLSHSRSRSSGRASARTFARRATVNPP
jgi:hypothetical protein